MSTARTALLALVLCTLPASAQDWSHWQWTGWPQWLGPHRNGISPETSLFGKTPSFKEAWRVHAGRGLSGLSVVGDRLYTMYIHSGEEYAVCLDARNGEVRWRTRTTGNTASEWRGGGSPRATPTVASKMIYVFSPHGKLHALDSQFGTQRWSRDMVREFEGIRPGPGFGASSPLVERNLVLIEAGGKKGLSLMAFDKTSGEVAWNTGSDERGYSSPIIATIGQTRQAVFFTGYGLIAIAPQNGRVLWKYTWMTSQSTNAATPVFIPPNRFFISSYGTGGAVVEVTATDKGYEVAEVWRNNNMQNYFATSIYYQGYLYGFDGATLKCLDAETGKEKWKTQGYGKGTLIVADSHLVILGERCNLGIAGATPAGFVEKANIRVFRNSQCETVPSLVDGQIYLRDNKEIVCMDVVGSVQ